MRVSGFRIEALYSLHYLVLPLAIFFCFFDASILNVQCIGWILKEDLGQHFIGWHAFRYDEWRWPIAWSNLLLAPSGITISVTDSNPLVSIILKPFSDFLPVETQYVGYWYLLSVTFAYLLAFAIIRRLCGYRSGDVQPTQRIGIVAGAALVTLAPYLFFRLVHDTLTAQWIVLAAIWIFLFTEAGVRQSRRDK